MKNKSLLTISMMCLLSSNIKAQTQVDTFYFTGATQTFTVSSSCNSPIFFDIRGGQGGNKGTAIGGFGGRVECSMSLNSGDVLYLNVGEAGIDDQISSSGVFVNSGGVFSYTSGTAGTGGGGSDIRLNGTNLTDRILVGGGGGGAGGYQPLEVMDGGTGGGLVAGDGIGWSTHPNSGGKGGTQSNGGAQGIASAGNCPLYTTDGALSFGGVGSGDAAAGGGGGGGYYGGGGSCFSSGGGGSSYTDPSATSINHSAGYQNGNGMIILTYNTNTTSNININACDSLVSPSGLYTWSTTGIYNDTIQNSAGCDSIIITDLIVSTINELVTQNGNTLTSSEVGATYQWVECPSMTAISGATSQSYTPQTSGIYAVMITNNNGCTKTSACQNVTVVGIIENDFGNELLIYPNPTNGNFSVDLGSSYENISFTITDLLGKQVLAKNYTNSQIINLKLDEPKGVYLLIVESKNKKAVIKLVKK